jgi:hypothetical protein
LPLTLICILGLENKVKSDGQECPSYTSTSI